MSQQRVSKGSDQLNLFPPDILASHLVLPGSEKAREMTVTSGRKCIDYSKKLTPLGLLARMLLATYPWASTKCYLTWTTSTTPGNRLLYQLVPSTQTTEDTDCSLSPTPQARDWKDSKFRSVKKAVGQYHKRNSPSLILTYIAKTGKMPMPEIYEIAMGFQIGWTDLSALETP